MTGRPRKHKSNAAKQAAYRRRKQTNERRELIEQILLRTPVRVGQRLSDFERELLPLSMRKLKEKLRTFVTTRSVIRS